MLRYTYILFSFSSSFLISCGSSTPPPQGTDSGEECAIGEEGCRCAENYQCDSGLLCAQGRCVPLPENTTAEDVSSTSTTANSDGEDTQTSTESETDTDTEGDSISCSSHAQCPASACNLELQTCMPEDQVLWVNNSIKACDDETGGTSEKPFCTFQAAWEQLGTGEWTIRLRGNDFEVADPGLTVQQGQQVAVLADMATYDYLQHIRIRQNPQLPPSALWTVSNQALLMLDGLHLMGGSRASLHNQNGTLWVERSSIRDGGNVSDPDYIQGGILTEGGNLHVHNSILTQNFNGIVVDDNATVELVNSFVTKNVGFQPGDDQNRYGQAFLVLSAASILVNYSTIYENATWVEWSSIHCFPDSISPGAFEFRNSLIYKESNTFSIMEACGVSMNHSVHDGNILINPGGKNMLFPNPNNQTWIDTSELGTTGVVRFTEEAPFATVARWQVNDPASDFENDLRPFQENSPDFPGADVPVKP